LSALRGTAAAAAVRDNPTVVWVRELNKIAGF
jgi:hypothetical protein